MNRITRLIRNGLAMLALSGAIGMMGLCFAADPPHRDTVHPPSPYNAHVGPGDWPQLGGSPHRNNLPGGMNIPTHWDINTGKNLKWSAKLGSQTFGNVVIANGQIYVGTNNGAGYLKRYSPKTDLGVLLCFRESDGEFLWQHSSEKLATGRVHDWPLMGICSAPILEGERAWFVTNRGEVVCLDAKGFYDHDEDDGPEIGVWKPSFDVAVNLSNQPTASKTACSPAAVKTTLMLLARGIDPKITASYYFKPTTKPDQWLATTTNNPSDQRTLYQVDFTPGAITITGLMGNDKVIQIDADLLAGLDEGQLSVGLRLLFTSHGVELSGATIPKVIERGKTWSFTVNMAGESKTFRLEKRLSTLVCEQQIESPEKTEADVVWKFNMMQELGTQQHNMATCAPTIWGDVLFVCTSNGVDETHQHLPAPDAPSFIALDKNTGKVLWTDNSPGQNIMHGQWSCPAVGIFGDVPQVIFPGGDGWLYSFRADRWNDRKPELLWKFDGNPKNSQFRIGGRSTRNGIIAVPVIHEGLVYLAMGEDPEHGEGDGHLWCIDPTKRGDVSGELVVDMHGQVLPHQRIRANASPVELFQLETEEWEQLDQGLMIPAIQAEFAKVGMALPPTTKLEARVPGQKWDLHAAFNGHERKFGLSVSTASQMSRKRRIAIRLYGKVSVVPNQNSGVVWHYTGQDIDGNGTVEFEETMHRTLGSPVIKNDLLIITDMSGIVHCLNSKTGKLHWTHDTLDMTWGTPLIVDQHVYCGTENGEVKIFDLAKTKSLLAEVSMGDAIVTMPVVASNVLYIANKNELFAIAAGANGSRRQRAINILGAE